MEEKLTYHSKEYRCRWINFSGIYYLIGSEHLEENLLLEESSYISREAKDIDEKIFFYVPEVIINADEVIIKSYVTQHICNGKKE